MKRMLNRFERAARSRRGGALPYMTIIVFALMTVTLAFQVNSLASKRRVEAVQHDLRAQNLLDAAIAESMTAIASTATNPASGLAYTGQVGSQNDPAMLDGGVFWVDPPVALGGNRFQLNAVALAGSGRAAAEVVVEVDVQAPLFQAVLNSDEQLTLNSGVSIDSYDSFVGDYASQAVNSYSHASSIGTKTYAYANQNGDVTSNAGITVNAQAGVFGDATPGVGYGFSWGTGSFVQGSTASSATPFLFPPITVPPIPITGSLALTPGKTQTLPSGKYGLKTLDIGKSASLTVQGPAQIVVDDFSGGKDARLMIDATNGPVTFYVTNSYTHINGFEAQPVKGSPMAVAFMIDAAQDIIFPSSSKIRGAYYAPNSRITFTSNNEAWGSFGGKRIDMANDMRFHFDEELAKHWQTNGGGGGEPVRILAWTREDVPGALARDRRDPFMLLGVTAGNLSFPEQAWQ